jgi:hypothetical protein
MSFGVAEYYYIDLGNLGHISERGKDETKESAMSREIKISCG